MKRSGIRLLSVILIVATLFSFSTYLYAEEKKEYLSDIRLVMAESYEKAREELKASIVYANYTLLPNNLNEGNSKYFGITDVDMGVYLAYTTTENVDEAITDIAVMDMNGGYQEGNMQAALEQSMKQYIKIAEKYVIAIDQMLEGVEAGNYLANAALRQLNIYYDSIAKKRVGTMFEEGVSPKALANMFLKANVHVSENLRALIAMGASYNEDGATYLEKVAEAAEKYNADPTVFDGENWYETATEIENTVGLLRDLINEYRYEKDGLDYEADEWGDEEMIHLRASTIAIYFEKTPYINGKNLADFILGYEFGGENYKQLYPLVAALNPGQKALTELGQFFDVVRYENTLFTEDVMDEEIAKIESEWSNGFDIYMGVDLEMYESTFAVTTEADRSSATSGRNIASEVFFRTNAIVSYAVNTVALVTDIAVYACRLSRAMKYNASLANQVNVAQAALDAASETVSATARELTTQALGVTEVYGNMTAPEALRSIAATLKIQLVEPNNMYSSLISIQALQKGSKVKLNDEMQEVVDIINARLNSASDAEFDAEQALNKAIADGNKTVSYKGMTTIFSGVMLCITAYQIGTWVYNYYNPKLSDIPSDMVDVIPTDNGDRFIHYEAVENIKPNNNGDYKPVCLNAFEGSRWIALYYTKSYEAGNALLPEFKISNKSGVAQKGFISVGKFGDENSYDLNTHAFKAKKSIYMSVAVSDDAKSAAEDVPTVVGSFIGTGGYFIAAAAGAGITAGAVLIAQKNKKTKAEESAE